MKTVALVANGHLDPILADQIRLCTAIIAVDGGLDHCHKLHLLPDLIIGDFDSTSKEILTYYPDTPLKRFPKEKDETDLELAIIHAFTLNPEKVFLFGALGKRADHTLTNLILLSRYPGRVILETEYEIIFAINETHTLKTAPGQTISLLALSPVDQVTTRGLKWELENARIDTSFFSQSNQALGEEVTINVGSGSLLCFLRASREKIISKISY